MRYANALDQMAADPMTGAQRVAPQPRARATTDYLASLAPATDVNAAAAAMAAHAQPMPSATDEARALAANAAQAANATITPPTPSNATPYVSPTAREALARQMGGNVDAQANAYAAHRLDQLRRVSSQLTGTLQLLHNASLPDPAAAWRAASAMLTQEAHANGYSDPRDYLAALLHANAHRFNLAGQA